MLRYDYSAFYWIFGVVRNVRLVLACEVCGSFTSQDVEAARGRLGSLPIPFMRRFGLVTFLAAVVGVCLVGAMVSIRFGGR